MSDEQKEKPLRWGHTNSGKGKYLALIIHRARGCCQVCALSVGW